MITTTDHKKLSSHSAQMAMNNLSERAHRTYIDGLGSVGGVVGVGWPSLKAIPPPRPN